METVGNRWLMEVEREELREIEGVRHCWVVAFVRLGERGKMETEGNH